jgi:hypothetical protein
VVDLPIRRPCHHRRNPCGTDCGAEFGSLSVRYRVGRRVAEAIGPCQGSTNSLLRAAWGPNMVSVTLIGLVCHDAETVSSITESITVRSCVSDRNDAAGSQRRYHLTRNVGAVMAPAVARNYGGNPERWSLE